MLFNSVEFLDKNTYNYIDFGEKINESKIPTTSIYDQHWNNYGRNIVSNLISTYFEERINNH
jgi:hypothetical protein